MPAQSHAAPELPGAVPSAALVGEATYKGDFAGLWPFIVFGQWTHAGKSATFALGRYEIVGPHKEAS